MGSQLTAHALRTSILQQAVGRLCRRVGSRLDDFRASHPSCGLYLRQPLRIARLRHYNSQPGNDTKYEDAIPEEHKGTLHKDVAQRFDHHIRLGYLATGRALAPNVPPAQFAFKPEASFLYVVAQRGTLRFPSLRC